MNGSDGNAQPGTMEPPANTSANSTIPPALVLAAVNAYNLWNEHWEHWSHMPPLEERTEYPYQNIRSRNFPWGDGDKVCNPRNVSLNLGANISRQTLLYV